MILGDLQSGSSSGDSPGYSPGDFFKLFLKSSADERDTFRPFKKVLAAVSSTEWHNGQLRDRRSQRGLRTRKSSLFLQAKHAVMSLKILLVKSSLLAIMAAYHSPAVFSVPQQISSIRQCLLVADFIRRSLNQRSVRLANQRCPRVSLKQ